MELLVQKTVEVNEPAFDPHDEHRIMINVSRGPLAMYKMVFGGKMDGETDRCSTWEGAEKMHEAMCHKVRAAGVE